MKITTKLLLNNNNEISGAMFFDKDNNELHYGLTTTIDMDNNKIYMLTYFNSYKEGLDSNLQKSLELALKLNSQKGEHNFN